MPHLAHGEQVDSAVVAGHTQQAAVAVKVDAEYVCRLRAPEIRNFEIPSSWPEDDSSPSELRDNGAWGRVKHPDQRPLGAGSGHFGALEIIRVIRTETWASVVTNI